MLGYVISLPCLSTVDPSERFWSQVDIGEPDACWIWKGKQDQGYGRFYMGSKRVYAHRAAWHLTYGPIPRGLNVLHKCDEPACVNPKHLRLGTQRQNMKDMVEKGRSLAGERNPGAKLKEDQVKEILRIHGEGKLNMKEISRLVGISYNVVRRIIKREDWKHV